MNTVSVHFSLNKSQAELDFVDVPVARDIPIFVDPFAISQRADAWSRDAHRVLIAFFQRVIDAIRSGNTAVAQRLMSQLHEPNETRFGLSRGRPKGAGIGIAQAGDMVGALAQSSAVQTGFLSSLEECELMVEGIGPDKISDITTNIIRGQLSAYTAQQCELHGIPVQEAPLPPCFDLDTLEWHSSFHRLPIAAGRPLLLVPKAIARVRFSYDHQQFYRHHALSYLQAEHLAANTSLVHALKNGERRVYKTDLIARFPLTKEYLFEFAKEHPEVLEDYREELSRLERLGPSAAIQPLDERVIAGALRLALRQISPGPESAGAFHKLMIGVVEFVFFPHLIHPVKEKEIHSGRKRIDIVMDNGAREGVFHRLHAVRNLPCAYICFECKNFSTDIANPELDQMIGRFSTLRGRAGLILCRKFENRARFVERCRDTLRDGHGLILGIDDQIVDTWLELIENENRPRIEDSLSDLVTEVYCS